MAVSFVTGSDDTVLDDVSSPTPSLMLFPSLETGRAVLFRAKVAGEPINHN
jgi:hypothetical protein